MTTQSNKPVAVITGVGPGLGAALAHRFAAAYDFAILARKADYLKALAAEIRKSGATVLDLPCDVSDPAKITNAFRAIRNDLGEPEVLLYNAGTAPSEMSPGSRPSSTKQTGGSTPSARLSPPRKSGRHDCARSSTMLFTGATAGIKAGAKSVSFGPAKFAMRGLAQSLARDLGPKAFTSRGSTSMAASTSRRARTQAQPEGRRLSQARRDRRNLLASRASGSERMDDGTRSPSLQGKILTTFGMLTQAA